ncbi:hypothetical protein SNEBB_002971 [Seison nebaliae]|nr:hypothetical protein SNEBB_002971 [Seison nebaliae]
MFRAIILLSFVATFYCVKHVIMDKTICSEKPQRPVDLLSEKTDRVFYSQFDKQKTIMRSGSTIYYECQRGKGEAVCDDRGRWQTSGQCFSNVNNEEPLFLGEMSSMDRGRAVVVKPKRKTNKRRRSARRMRRFRRRMVYQ